MGDSLAWGDSPGELDEGLALGFLELVVKVVEEAGEGAIGLDLLDNGEDLILGADLLVNVLLEERVGGVILLLLGKIHNAVDGGGGGLLSLVNQLPDLKGSLPVIAILRGRLQSQKRQRGVKKVNWGTRENGRPSNLIQSKSSQREGFA